MTSMALSVVVVALMVATLAIFLYAVGVFLNRTSGSFLIALPAILRTALRT
jgi:hypothetical protein